MVLGESGTKEGKDNYSMYFYSGGSLQLLDSSFPSLAFHNPAKALSKPWMEPDQEGLIKYIPHAFSPTHTPSVFWLLQAFHRGIMKLTAGFEFGSMYCAFS